MVEELKLAIKIDDDAIEQSLLKQFANAEKMADKVILTFKNINLDDKNIEAKFKEMQKMAGKNPIDLSIDKSSIEMLSAISKQLGNIFDIAKGKSVIDSSATVADINKITNAINGLNSSLSKSNTSALQEEEKQIQKNIDSIKKLLDLKYEVKNVNKSSYSGKGNVDWIRIYKSQEEAISSDLSDRKEKLHSSLNLILSEDKNALSSLEEEATKLKIALQSVQEMSNRISSNSSISDLDKNKGSEEWYKGYAEAYKAIDDRLGELNNQYRLTNEELEEYITLQVKAEKIMDKMVSRNGGVKGSGAKDKIELKSWIKKTFATDLGLNPEDIYRGLFGNITDALYDGNGISLFDSEGAKRSLREISAEILNYKSTISGFSGSFGANKDAEKLREINSILNYIKNNASEIESTDFSSQIKKASELVDYYSQKLSEGEHTDYYSKSLKDAQNDLQNLISLQERLNATKDKQTNEIITEQQSSSLVEQQSKIQEELKETQKQAEQTEQSIKSITSEAPIKDTIQDDTDKSNVDNVTSATEEAVQAKKDFATANEGVQSSVDASKSQLELEAELMSNIAESARKAADAKKEFVEANEKVKDSTGNSNDSLKKDKYKDKSKISEEDYTARSDYFASIANKKLTDSGKTILGNNVNTELVDGLVKVNAKIKEADGTWKTFSAKIDADGNMFEQRFRTITKNVDKLDKELKDFELDSSPALSYGETLEKAKQIRESLNLGDEFTVKVDSNELVTITKKLDDVNSSAISVTQTFKSAQDAIDNFGKETSNIAEKTSVALKNIKEKKDNVTSNTQSQKDDVQSSVDKALKDQIDAWKKIQNIREKIAKSNNSDEISALNESKESYQKQYDAAEKVLKANSNLYDKEAQLLKIEQIRLETNTKIAKYKGDVTEAQLSSAEESINKFQSKLSSLKLKPDDEHRFPKYTEYINQLDNAIVKYSNQITSLRTKQNNGGIISENDIKQAKELEDDITNLFQQIKKFSAGEKGYENISVTKIASQINKLLEDNTRMSEEAKNKIKEYYAEVSKGNPTRPLKDIYNDALKIVQLEKEADRGGKSFLSAIKDKVWYGTAAQIAGMFSIYDAINIGRQIVDAVKEIDTATTELRKVSDATDQRLVANFKNSAETAKDLGASVSDVISATADWSRMGYGINESEELARISTLYKNVGDGIDIEEANNSLISTLQGFQLTANDAESIIDKFNEVSNNFAIDSAGIGEALQRSAASFNAANTDLSKSIALITATRLQKLVEYMETYIKNIFNCHRSLYYYAPQYRGNYYMMV